MRVCKIMHKKGETMKSVREIRKEHGLSTEFVASKLSLKRYSYLRRERGEVAWKIDELKAFSLLVNVPVDQILT